MASFDASGNAFNAANFYNSLLAAAKRGFLTADQVQAVWAPYTEAFQSGAAHLAEAPAVWQALADRVRDRKIAFSDALVQWSAFVASGALPLPSQGTSLLMSAAAARTRPLGTIDPISIVGASSAMAAGGQGGPPVVLQAQGDDNGKKPGAGGGNGVRAESPEAWPPGCHCCLVRKSKKIDVPGTQDPTWHEKRFYWFHELTIKISVEWVNTLSQKPCSLEWWEYGRPSQGTAMVGDEWIDVYRLASFKKVLTEVTGNYEFQPPQFEDWRKDMEATDCPKAREDYTFKDNPGTQKGDKSKTVVRNFIIRFRCSGACEEKRSADCKPPIEIRLQQRIQLDDGGRPVKGASHLKELKPTEAFDDKAAAEPTRTFDPVEFYQKNFSDYPKLDKAIQKWNERGA